MEKSDKGESNEKMRERTMKMAFEILGLLIST